MCIKDTSLTGQEFAKGNNTWGKIYIYVLKPHIYMSKTIKHL